MVNLSKKNFIRKGSKWLGKISEWVKTHGDGQIIPMSCEFEQEYFDLKDDPAAQKGTFRFNPINALNEAILRNSCDGNSGGNAILLSCHLYVHDTRSISYLISFVALLHFVTFSVFGRMYPKS